MVELKPVTMLQGLDPNHRPEILLRFLPFSLRHKTTRPLYNKILKTIKPGGRSEPLSQDIKGTVGFTGDLEMNSQAHTLCLTGGYPSFVPFAPLSSINDPFSDMTHGLRQICEISKLLVIHL